MGERNFAACNYLSKKEIFADFVNGTIFNGKQTVVADNLEHCDRVYKLQNRK